MNNEKITKLLLLLFLSIILILHPFLGKFNFGGSISLSNLFHMDSPLGSIDTVIYNLFLIIGLVGNLLFYSVLYLLTKEVFSKK
ncbi:hypothetical protein WG909_09735 [Peptostreptococcaceae bacterium AGR-M142]